MRIGNPGRAAAVRAIGTATALAALLAMGAASAAFAENGHSGSHGKGATSAKILLSGSVSDAIGGASCTPTDTVPVSGKVHLVRHGGMVHVNLADVSGTGTPSGDDYEGVGAYRFTSVNSPTAQLFHTFKLENTTNSCANSSLPVCITLSPTLSDSTATIEPQSSCGSP